jgi:hypothetical protein
MHNPQYTLLDPRLGRLKEVDVRKALIAAGILGLGAGSYYGLKTIEAGWAGFGAELLVALVIYLELKANRFAVFESKALDADTRKERADIYTAFFESHSGPGSLDSRRTAFAERLRTDKELRAACENQIILLNHLWFLLRWSPIRRRQVSKWFPHVVVPFWVMLGPYVLRKQQTRGGWTEDDLMDFTLKCISFVESRRCTGRWRWLQRMPFLTPSPPLVMWGSDPNDAVVISDDLLRNMKQEIKTARFKRWCLRPVRDASAQSGGGVPPRAPQKAV